MVFAENKEQIEPYTFNDMLLQPDNSCFILAKIKEVETHESRSHWKLMKKSEVNNKHKINMVNSRLLYPFGISIAREYQKK